MSPYKVTRSSITSRAEHEIWHTAAHVAWSVCVSVGHEDEPIKDSQTDRHRLYQRDIYAVNVSDAYSKPNVVWPWASPATRQWGGQCCMGSGQDDSSSVGGVEYGERAALCPEKKEILPL